MNTRNKWIAMLACTTAAGMMMQMTGLAAAGTVPSDTKTVSVKIKNVDGVESAKAYRVVKPVYNEEGFVKFQTISGVTLSDIENPTSEEVTAIAKALAAGTLTAQSYDLHAQTTGDGYEVLGDVPAGEYIVLLTDSLNADYIYNPMVVSAYFTDANEEDSLISAPVLNAAEDHTFYAKRFDIPLDKEITGADGNTVMDDDSEDGYQADDLGVGDTASFTIRTKFPVYSQAYKANGVQFMINDSQDAGFDAPENMKVYVDGTEVAQGLNTFSYQVRGNDFAVDFASDFVLAHTGGDVVVTYDSRLNENCEQKFSPNNNTVKLTYSNSVTDKSKVSEKVDEVSEYTFPIEIKKVAAIDGKDTHGGQPLKGAEFTLTRTGADGKTGVNTYTVATDENGIADFPKLDEGIYHVRETKAPEGYAINPDEYEVRIVPEYQLDGSLKQYTVTMKDLTTDTAVGNIVIDSPDDDILAGNITDSRLQVLPSTGGNGTMWATILAGLFAAMTGGVFLYGKKKDEV